MAIGQKLLTAVTTVMLILTGMNALMQAMNTLPEYGLQARLVGKRLRACEGVRTHLTAPSGYLIVTGCAFGPPCSPCSSPLEQRCFPRLWLPATSMRRIRLPRPP